MTCKTPRTHTTPPKLASLLLKLCLPAHRRDSIMGDLEEEFYDRAGESTEAARWYWHQSVRTSALCIREKLTAPFLGAMLNQILPLGLCTVMIMMVFFLSNMDSLDAYDDGAWDALMAGRIDFFLFEPEFWRSVPGQITTKFSIDMFINIPSFLYAIAGFAVLVLLTRNSHFGALRTALWGYSLCLSPYLWGLIQIALHHYAPREVGPVIAFMLISPLYLLLPVSILVHRKLNHKQRCVRGVGL